MNLIIERLVRNNGWVIQRYAPKSIRQREQEEMLARYECIALKENAADGYALGMAELLETVDQQPDREMDAALYDRFTGATRVRDSLIEVVSVYGVRTVQLVSEGKNASVIRCVLRELGLVEISGDGDSDALVIRTLSPGPALDAMSRSMGMTKPVISPGCPLAVHDYATMSPKGST